jgi:hypothetical protein
VLWPLPHAVAVSRGQIRWPLCLKTFGARGTVLEFDLRTSCMVGRCSKLKSLHQSFPLLDIFGYCPMN